MTSQMSCSNIDKVQPSILGAAYRNKSLKLPHLTSVSWRRREDMRNNCRRNGVLIVLVIDLFSLLPEARQQRHVGM